MKAEIERNGEYFDVYFDYTVIPKQKASWNEDTGGSPPEPNLIEIDNIRNSNGNELELTEEELELLKEVAAEDEEESKPSFSTFFRGLVIDYTRSYWANFKGNN